MNYGKDITEKNEVVKAQYYNAVKGYKTALKLFESGCDFSNPEFLKVLVHECHSCHDSLFSAFEISLKILTGNSASGDPSKRFPSLKQLADELEEIASGINSNSMPGIDYSLVGSIDLNRIVTTKDARNDLTHNGIIREFRHYSSLFSNLEKLITMLEPDFRASSIIFESSSKEDIFDKFFDTVEKLDAPYCAYALILDSTWDIPNDQLDSLISLPWDIIVDLDGRGIGRNAQRGRSRIENAIIRTGSVPIPFYARNFDPNAFSVVQALDKIPYLNFSDGEIVLNQNIDPSINTLQAEKIRANRKCHRQLEAAIERNIQTKTAKMSSLRLFLQTYLGNRLQRCIVVSTAEFKDGINSVRDIIDILADKYNQDIRVVLAQDPDEEYLGMPVWYTNGIATKLNCEIKEFIAAIDQHRSFLPAGRGQCVSKSAEVYRFPMRDGSVESFEVNFVMKNVEDYFELLHLDVGNEPGENDIEKFYRGHIVTWSALRRGCAADIVKDRRERLEQQIKSAFTVSPDVKHAYYILHEPGSGGTTLGRQIAWNIHMRFPVVRLKHYDKNVVHRINDLYKELKQTPFLILIDSNYEIPEESIHAMNQLFTNQFSTLPPVVGLFVRRKQTVDGRGQSDRTNPLSLAIVQPEQQKIVQEKCLEYARRFYSTQEEIERRVSSLYKNISISYRYPMIINLYIMDKNFVSPEQYVKSFLNQESMSEDIKKALLFIALYSYSTGNELPGKFVYFVCNRKSAGMPQRLKLLLKPYEHLLLFVEGNSISSRRSEEPDAVNCRHHLFAEELLHCLLGNQWKSELKILSLDFLEYALQSRMDQSITNVLSRLFARKESYKIEDNNSNGMTKLIHEVITAGLQSDGIDLLTTVGERMYKYINEHPELVNDVDSEDRHLFGLLARVWAQCARYYRKLNYDQDLMDKFTEKSLSTLTVKDDETNRDFYDLYHMAGCCWQVKLEKSLEGLASDSSDDKLDEIRSIYKTAIDCFEESIRLGNPDYGLPSLILTHELVVRYIFSHLGFDEKSYRPEALETPKYSWVLDVIDEANRLIDSEDDYALDSDGRDSFNWAANKFRHTYLHKNSSLILQSLQNYLDRISSKSGADYEHSVLRTYIQMIHYTLYKYKRENEDIDYIRLANNKNDFEKINRYVKEALKHYGDKSHFLYRLWFKLAKLGDVSFSEAKQRAQDWKAVPVKPGQKMVWPYYYMYIISLLSGQPKSDVEGTWSELQRRLKLDRDEGKSELMCDYYQAGKEGIGCLVDRAWARFNDVENNEMISWIRGTIAYISDNEASGYINTFEVKYLDRQPRIKLEEGQIFFRPASTRLTQRSLKEEVEFKFGFSLKRIQAIDKTVCLTSEKDKVRSNTSTGQSMGPWSDRQQKQVQQKASHPVIPEKATLSPKGTLQSDVEKYQKHPHNTIQQLTTEIGENAVKKDNAEKTLINVLPNFVNKVVQFVAKEESSRGGLKGTFEVDGQIRDGIITTGINKKEIKNLLKYSGKIRAKIIGQSPKGYILKKIQ